MIYAFQFPMNKNFERNLIILNIHGQLLLEIKTLFKFLSSNIFQNFNNNKILIKQALTVI